MMTSPPRRRDLINRKALETRLAGLELDLDPATRRLAMLEILKAALTDGRNEVRRRFEAKPDGTRAAHELSYVIDQLIRIAHDDTVLRVYPVNNRTTGERLSLVAVGGYGRGQLAPYSDVDILFLLPYKQTPHGEQVIEHMLYLFWDLGLKIGHATRSVEECQRMARADITIRTALLETRYLWGDEELYRELRQRFLAEITSASTRGFVEAKLAERNDRHTRMGDSRYVLEPNIKDGKGGLRDLHTLVWIAKYAYKVDSVSHLVERGILNPVEARKFAKAERFLWTLRFHLHYLAKRPEERLTFDVQTELAKRMNYTDHAGSRGVERFMKHYFLVAKDAGDLTRIFCAALEAEQERKPRFAAISRLWNNWRKERYGFQIDGERLSVGNAAAFLADPVNFIRLFWVAHKYKLEIHPVALRLIARNLPVIDKNMRANPEANRLFLAILTSRSDPEIILRRMNEAGVFGRFIPDFGRVVAQMQYDMYHVYTVDEHTLFAIGILSRIERGLLKEELPLATSIMPTVTSRRALYVAMLLHDIAKGRHGDHSQLGEQVAYKLGPRLGLRDEETASAAWLVRHHLTMSSTAFQRDLHDPRTITRFADIVQSPERLKLLLILTAADIRAVGPRVWNNWKASLLRELYALTEEKLIGNLNADDGAVVRRRRADAILAELHQVLRDWSDAEFTAHVQRGHTAYWLSADVPTLARHARMVRRAQAENLPLAVESKVDASRGVTDVTIYCGDHPGIFARIAGALAVAGGNIVDARIFTLSNGMVLDSFSIQDSAGHAFDRSDRLARLSVMIEQALNGKLRSMADLGGLRAGASRLPVFTIAPRVLIDNQASATHTVIEINGRDRPGLLHDIGSAMAGLNLQIHSAKISTYGEHVVDVFYVHDIFGLKLDQPMKQEAVRRTLLGVMETRSIDR